MLARNFADLQRSELLDGCLGARRRPRSQREEGATKLAGGVRGRRALALAIVHGEAGIGPHPPIPGEGGGGEDGSRRE